MSNSYHSSQYQLKRDSGYYSRMEIVAATSNSFFTLNDYLVNAGDALNYKLITARNERNCSFIVELPSQKNVLDIIKNSSDDIYSPTLFGLDLSNYRYIHTIYDSKHHGSCGEFYYDCNGVIMSWRIAYNNNDVSNIRKLIDETFVTYRILPKNSFRMKPVCYLNNLSGQELADIDCSNSFFRDKKLGDDVIKMFFNDDVLF